MVAGIDTIYFVFKFSRRLMDVSDLGTNTLNNLGTNTLNNSE